MPKGVSFAWFVAVHEYLHTRGASDKYGSDGRAVLPDGYGDPTQVLLYPQSATELMAHGRPISEQGELPPGDADTWVVGASTATEIGWIH